jgi:hypothetical protein
MAPGPPLNFIFFKSIVYLDMLGVYIYIKVVSTQFDVGESESDVSFGYVTP